MTTSKRAGARFEQQVADYLTQHGFPYAEVGEGQVLGVLGLTIIALGGNDDDEASPAL